MYVDNHYFSLAFFRRFPNNCGDNSRRLLRVNVETARTEELRALLRTPPFGPDLQLCLPARCFSHFVSVRPQEELLADHENPAAKGQKLRHRHWSFHPSPFPSSPKSPISSTGPKK